MSSILAAEEPSDTGLEGNDPGATTEPSGTPSEEQEDSATAYRKLQGENDKLKGQSEKLQGEYDAYKQSVAPKEQFYDALQNKPEYIPVIRQAVEAYERGETGVAQEGFNPEEDFIPDEAYKPGTPSFKYREDQEDKRVQKVVTAAIDGIRGEQRMDQTLKNLTAAGMSEEHASGYMDFLQNPEKYPGGKELLMGPMAKAFEQFKSGSTQESGVAADAVQTQESFPSAGALSGGSAAPRSETDRIMDNIIASGQSRTILKNPL